MHEETPAAAEKSSLAEVTLLFLRLGMTAFGGPAAHVGILEDELVRRRRWLSREEFLDLLGAVNLIPGPNSTEMAIHIGYLRAGWPGLIAAGCAFILPAAIMVTALAWACVQFGSLPEFAGLLYGMKPVVIAVIAQALWRLGRTALKTRLLAAIAVLVVVAATLNVDALVLLLGGGVVVGLMRGGGSPLTMRVKPLLVMLLVAGGILAFAYCITRIGSPADNEYGLTALFLYFLKIGSVLYGSGYVLLAFLQTDLVYRWQWLTTTQLLDATAAGQVTPGPLFTTATFIGYIKGFAAGGLAGGLLGAAVATIGIFLPSFIFIALCGRLVSRLRESPVAAAFLDGVNASALALMAVVTWQLARSAVTDVTTALLALASLAVLIRFRLNAVWLILAGALLGLLLAAAGISAGR